MIVDSTICFFLSQVGIPQSSHQGNQMVIWVMFSLLQTPGSFILRTSSKTAGFSISPTHEDEFDFLDSLSSLGIKSD